MNKIRHGIAGLLLFTILVSLFVSVYVGFQDGYGFVSDEIVVDGVLTDKSIMDVFKERILIADGLSSVTNVFRAENYGNVGLGFDTLVRGGFGLVKSILGVFTFPFEIAKLVTDYYGVPIVVTEGIVIMMVVYIAFIILSSQTKGGDL